MMIIYPLGVPLVMLGLVYRRRKDIETRETRNGDASLSSISLLFGGSLRVKRMPLRWHCGGIIATLVESGDLVWGYRAKRRLRNAVLAFVS